MARITVSRCQQFLSIHMFLCLLGPAGAFVTASCAASRGDIDFIAAESLPEEVWKVLSADDAHSVGIWINPFYLQGDFDGDGARDTAVLVMKRATGKRGPAVVTGSGKLHLIGAGEDIGNGTTDLDWMDAWYVEPRNRIPKRLKAKGDGIVAMKTESGSGLIWWDGKRFQWLQRGD